MKAKDVVLFLAPGDVAKGRVEPISWMQTCTAYAEKGLEVTLVSLKIRRPDAVTTGAVWRHYGLDPTFRLVVIPTRLHRDSSTAATRTWAGATAIVVAFHTLLRQIVRPRRVIIHTRLPVLAAPFVLTAWLLPRSRRPRLILETHVLPRTSHGWVLRRVDLVVTNSQKLADEITAKLVVPAERVVHAPLPPFNYVEAKDKAAARVALDLPDVPIACYAGKLTQQQSEFLLRLAVELAGTTPEIRLLIVGGNPEILEWTRSRAVELAVTDFVLLAGFVDPSRVEDYLASADVLVYHMPATMAIFPYCTPAKGYEYQAAQRPIVATDLPLFEEVFGPDRDRAIRVHERTPEAVADRVREAFALGDEGQAMAARAAAWISERTWERRAEAILDALAR